MRHLLIAIGSSLILALVAAGPATADVIDFEAQTVATGGNLTGIPNSPLTIGLATFTGGELLNSEVGLPADHTGVYASEGLFGSGETNPLVINFGSPVSDFTIFVVNGDSEQSYTVSDNLGDSVAMTFASAGSLGAATFSLPGQGLTTVNITSGDLTAWDFSIDNVTSAGVSPIPEPTPLILLGAGFLMVVVLHRKTPSRLKLRKITIAFVICAAAILLVAQQSDTEAPAGFTTPTIGQAIGPTGELTVNSGSESISNGITEPPGDTFALDQAQFERRHDLSTGLGPVFNATACVDCHNNSVAGAAGQFTELRAGHNDLNGNFMNPTITIDGGLNTISGRSIVNDRAICPQAHEHLPDTENIRTFRAVLNTLGDGFVEAVDDRTFLAIAANQPSESNGLIHGETVQVPILEAPGQTGVGKFGWKDQDPTILSFSADAYLNEMGVTNRLKPKDVTSVCKVTTDPEDTPDALGLADIDHFAQFIRGTQVPPRDPVLSATSSAIAGQNLFSSIGCVICHVATLTTDRPGTVLNGGTYSVPAAIANKIFHPYSDFRLHDVGTGDGIVQGGLPDTANKMRTAPLWGLRIKSRFMHDNASVTLPDAIQRHQGEARGVIAKSAP